MVDWSVLKEFTVNGTVPVVSDFLKKCLSQEKSPPYFQTVPRDTVSSTTSICMEIDAAGSMSNQVGKIELQQLPNQRVLLTFSLREHVSEVHRRCCGELADRLIAYLKQYGFIYAPPPSKSPIGFKPKSD